MSRLVYEPFPDDWTLIADVDESEPYEIDQTSLYRKPDGTFALATASGCSCWSGDWDVEDFDTLDAVEASFRNDAADQRRYTPTWAGADELMRQAREATA